MQQQGYQPLFAPAGQHGVDEFDLGEIFAEYFVNEFDNDPMNAYTNSMANYGGGASAVATGMMQKQEGAVAGQVTNPGAAVSLPTGGIRTAFHHGAPPGQPAQEQVYAEQPVAKKPRQEVVQQAFLSPQGGIVPQPGVAAPQVAGGVALPVGVGIRLGGPGGISPATAQTAARAPGTQAQYAWGGPGSLPPGVQPDHAAAERRQRNREHAKRSRVRKKFMLESLQGEVLELQKENQRLRMLVQEHIPNDAMKIISECCASSPLFSNDELGIDDSLQNRKTETLTKSDYSLITSLTTGQQCFVLSDPKLPDNPIVFASPGFYKLTGYSSKEVLGRNCRFLQGPGTNPKAVEVIRKALAAGSDATVCILNYKADGTPFWNQFFVAALRDSDNSIVNYVGVQCEVEPDAGAQALEERVNAVLPLQPKDEKGEGGSEGA